MLLSFRKGKMSWSLASSFTIFRCNSCTPTSLVVYTHSTQTSLLSRIHTTSTLPYLDTILHSHITCSRPPMAQTLSFKYRCIFFHLHFLLHFLFHSLYFFIDLHLTVNYFYSFVKFNFFTNCNRPKRFCGKKKKKKGRSTKTCRKFFLFFAWGLSFDFSKFNDDFTPVFFSFFRF